MMDIHSKTGTKVRFAFPDAGYPDDVEKCQQHLKENEVYTIDHTDVGGWRTNVYLQEIPGVPFNSVSFDVA